MQSPQHFIDDYGPRAPGRLFSFYGLFAAWYVFGIVVVQTLGIEPMYKQLTPFYGNYYPASHIAGVTTAGFLVALIAYAVVRWSAGVPISRRVQFVLLLLAAGLLCALQLAASLGAGDATLGDFITDFRWQLPVVAVAVVAAIAAVRGFRHVNWWDNELPSKTAWRVVITLAIFSFVFAGSVAMVRGGFDGISGAYSRTKYEYVDDIGKGITLLGFLRSYNELHPLLSMHAKVHPPGPVVILWIMSSFLFSRDALVLSLGTMAVGSFALLPLFAWVRDMLGQRVALTCCAFYTLVPSIVLFTATSADILFTPLTFLTLLFFWRALHRGSAPYAAAAGVMYALLSLTSFSLISLGAFFAFVGLWRLRDGTLRMRVVKTAVVMLASFLIFHGAFRLLTGFDVIECFR
ncbi:MAG: glycosyltransferase family 39 protein, partial [Candidatus Hydrogenedentes bacterium]|nr:glycosyltransferase family 39 protein [Candidatus Hydrogenedentota bacterium]